MLRRLARKRWLVVLTYCYQPGQSDANQVVFVRAAAA